MRGVVYNFFNSEINVNQDAFSIRTALLFCNELTYCGIGRGVFTMASDLNSITFEMKLHWVADEMKKEGRTDAIDADSLYKEYKLLNHKKGKTKEEIIWIKRVENFVNKWIKAITDDIENRVDANPLSILKPFTEKKYFHVLSQHMSYPEKTDIVGGYTLVSEMLSLEVNYDKKKKSEEDFEDPVFILPHNYFYEKNNDKEGDANDIFPYSPAFEYSYKLFTLPNINNATIPELEILRTYIQTNFIEFQETLDEWIRQVYTNQKNHELFLTNKLLPLSKKMEEELNEHELIDHYDLLGERKFMCRVIAGVCRLSDIWCFFNAYKAIPVETWIALLKIKEESELSDMLFPFISFENPAANSIDKAEQVDNDADSEIEERIKPAKKNLDID